MEDELIIKSLLDYFDNREKVLIEANRKLSEKVHQLEIDIENLRDRETTKECEKYGIRRSVGSNRRV